MNGRPVFILLVEDDEAHAEIVRRNLADARVANQLIHLTDGQAALDYMNCQGAFAPPVQTKTPDLILLDLRLPKVDGQEVLRRLKADSRHKAVPVVVLTTSRSEQDMISAYGLGAGSYLVKPVNFEKFMELMEAFGYYWLAWNQFPYVPSRDQSPREELS